MKLKLLAVLFLLLITFGLGNFLTVKKYKSAITMSTLFQIPENMEEWQGRDISNSLDINMEEARFGFISDSLAYAYTNEKGENLIFIMLDAGNFHDPKNCFISSGYEIHELPDSAFKLPDHVLNTHALFIKRKGKNFLSLYWIIINKNIAHHWVEQKIKQLYFSIFNKKRIGLMVRIDIPANENAIQETMNTAKDFILTLNKSLNPDQAGYIFGEI